MQTIDRIPLQPITNTYSSYAVWRIFCSQPTTNKWRDTVSEHSFSYSSSALRIVALAGALGLAACGGGGDDSGGGGQGTLKVSMTDAPACGFDHVFVTVNRVRVNTNANADPGGSGWVDINVSPARKIDLLSLTNGVLSTLGQTALPAGNYQQIRLVLDPNNGAGAAALANSVVPTGGSEQTLDTPSAVQSGIKINRPFTVSSGTLTDWCWTSTPASRW